MTSEQSCLLWFCWERSYVFLGLPQYFKVYLFLEILIASSWYRSGDDMRFVVHSCKRIGFCGYLNWCLSLYTHGRHFSRSAVDLLADKAMIAFWGEKSPVCPTTNTKHFAGRAVSFGGSVLAVGFVRGEEAMPQSLSASNCTISVAVE